MENRYARQLLLDEVGEEGQEKLQKATVLVIGAGGLGCPVLTYLACAGVGFIKVVDHDTISESNLNRQFLYGNKDIGESKALIAKQRLMRQNPNIVIDAYLEKITEKNVMKYLEGIDVVVDCVDNIETRLILNQSCIKNNIPLIEAGIDGFYGFVTVIEKQGACLECIGFSKEQPKRISSVIGVTAGIIGSIQANECIQNILGIESNISGKYLQYDGKKQTLTKVNVKISSECRVHAELN